MNNNKIKTSMSVQTDEHLCYVSAVAGNNITILLGDGATLVCGNNCRVICNCDDYEYPTVECGNGCTIIGKCHLTHGKEAIIIDGISDDKTSAYVIDACMDYKEVVHNADYIDDTSRGPYEC